MTDSSKLLDMEKMRRLEQETFAFPPSDPVCEMTGNKIFVSGVDNAVKVLTYATGKRPEGSYLVHRENLEKIGGLSEDTLRGLASYSTNLDLRSGSRIPEKEPLRLILSLAHYLLNDSPAEGIEYDYSGKFYKESIKFFLEKMDLGPLIPAEDIPGTLQQLHVIADKENRKNRERSK